MTDFYEDDEDPQAIRAALDAGMHIACRAALDAAQDEIERLLSEVQTLRASGDSPGAGMIAEERSRQVNVEGYSREHDAGHGSRNLSLAATAYALDHRGHWPWERDSFKPTRDRVRDLTKAGALIAAAIDVELAARDSGGAS